MTVPAAWWLVLGSFLAAQAGILLLLRQNQERAAAGLAVVCAAPGLVLALAAPATNLIYFRTHFAAPGALAPLSLILFPVEVMLLMAGARALISLGPEGWRSRLLGVLAVGGLVAAGLLIAMLGIENPVHVFPYEAGGHNESSAVGRLRTIHKAAEDYASAYQNGFPASLASLGQPAAGAVAGCDAADLFYYSESEPYRYMYVPGSPLEQPARGCATPGVRSYAVQARPKAYKGTGRRSFLVDESGAIHWTCEDRAATAQDPPL